MNIVLIREPVIRQPGVEAFTPGKLYINGVFFCFALEDEDRKLEWSGIVGKVYGKTAIPKGIYQVVVSHSPRFGRALSAVLDVPGFSGIRIHGGNRAEDSLGCILVGHVRTATGIAQCADAVRRIIDMINASKKAVMLEIK